MFMNDFQKISLLKEVLIKTAPQRVDYEPHAGSYSVELSSLQPIVINCEQCRTFMVNGNLEGNTISATLETNRKTIFTILHLPYVAHEGDRTPIYKIVRASVLFAYGALQLPYLYQNLKKIPITDFPFKIQNNDKQIKREIDFMKKLSTVYRDKKSHIGAQATVIHPTSSKLKEIINYYDKEEEEEVALHKKIMESIETLKSVVPTKEDIDNATPDVFVWDYDAEYPSEKFDNRVIVLNTGCGSKERFWWDYLKLNIYLSDVEYSFGYYLLMNRWKLGTIQKWIEEYRAKGLYESTRAKDFMVIYMKTTDKSAVRILNSDGKVAKVKVSRRMSR